MYYIYIYYVISPSSVTTQLSTFMLFFFKLGSKQWFGWVGIVHYKILPPISRVSLIWEAKVEMKAWVGFEFLTLGSNLFKEVTRESSNFSVDALESFHCHQYHLVELTFSPSLGNGDSKPDTSNSHDTMMPLRLMNPEKHPQSQRPVHVGVFWPKGAMTGRILVNGTVKDQVWLLDCFCKVLPRSVEIIFHCICSLLVSKSKAPQSQKDCRLSCWHTPLGMAYVFEDECLEFAIVRHQDFSNIGCCAINHRPWSVIHDFPSQSPVWQACGISGTVFSKG